jgi:predicted SprT family Zn-dependent metalloprotease
MSRRTAEKKNKKKKKYIFSYSCKICGHNSQTPEAITQKRLEECLETLNYCPWCESFAPGGLKEIFYVTERRDA